jgi:pilus assembly protein CpaB
MQVKRSLLFLALSAALGIAALTPVVIALSDLPVGEALDPRQLDSIAWPEAHLPAGTVSSTGALEGRILKRPVVAGEPILESALLPAGTVGGLTSVIEPSHRAVSVKVDQVVGVAGFVKPGARVDVLTTLRKVNGSDDHARSRVILQNVPVLAVDQKMQTASDGKPELVNVVTLSVDPDQSQRLVLGAHEGKLQLALRNPSDSEILQLRSVTAADVLGIQRAAAAKPATGGGTSVQILKGTAVTSKVF